MITDAQGTLLAVHTTPANVRDDQAVPMLLNKLNQSLERPIASLHGDRAYGFDWTIQIVKEHRIESVLAERDEPATAHGSGLGMIRRVVEQALAHIGHCRRLKLCYEKTAEHFQAFHDLAAALLCFKRLCYYRRL